MMNKTIQFLINAVKQAWAKSQAQWQQEQQRQTHNLIISQMYAMTDDLYAAFCGKSYAHLVQVSSAADIRLHNYKQTSDGYLYQFTLSKQNPDNKIASVHIASILRNMNTDIVNAQRMILYNYGGAYLSHLYPFLNAGLYVLAVTDSGGADVIITVATHIQP